VTIGPALSRKGSIPVAPISDTEKAKIVFDEVIRKNEKAAQMAIRDVKAGLGLEGWIIRLSTLSERLERFEDEICERKIRWDSQIKNPGMEVYRKINESHIKALAKLLTKTKREIHYVVNVMEEIYGEKKVSERQEVTEDMIERARHYPLENLIDIKRGMTNCISGSHVDKNASMDARNNFCHCYACGWTGDTLTVYMKLNGVDFIAAVKALQ
jgi:hypothetical protein